MLTTKMPQGLAIWVSYFSIHNDPVDGFQSLGFKSHLYAEYAYCFSSSLNFFPDARLTYPTA